MRLAIIAATIVAFALIACNSSEKPTAGPRPGDTILETPEATESAPIGNLLTLGRAKNTLVETPEYTGVIFTRKGAFEFSFLFDPSSMGFWEPSPTDVSRAESCIRQHIESVRDNTEPDAYPQAHATFILENFGQYRRQYVGIIVGDEKRIWVNSFLAEDDSYPDWQQRPVYVLDGGNYYWEIVYVLATDECIDFHVHGEA